MGINPITTTGYPAWRTAKTNQSKSTSAEFEQQKNMVKVQKQAPKTHTVYLKTDDMIYSGGNGTGLSFYIKYTPESTEEDPIVKAKGVDEDGNEFERTIHINQINPRNATLVEMRALEAHLGVDKKDGLSSLPMCYGDMGLNDRKNFMDAFRRQIQDMKVLKQQQLVSYYTYSMRMYQNFIDRDKL